MRINIILLPIVLILLTGCSTNARQKASETTEIIAYVPLLVALAPAVAVGAISTADDNSVGTGDYKYEVERLIGEAENIYTCQDSSRGNIEIWEYDKISIKDKNRFLVFDEEGLLFDYSSTWQYRKNCKLKPRETDD